MYNNVGGYPSPQQMGYSSGGYGMPMNQGGMGYGTGVGGYPNAPTGQFMGYNSGQGMGYNAGPMGGYGGPMGGYGSPMGGPGMGYAGGPIGGAMGGPMGAPIGGTGTMSCNPEQEAQALRTAMKGFGTDEKGIMAVILRTNSYERAEIKRVYKSAFGRDLIDDLKKELSGNFEDVCVGMFMTPAEYDAYCLYKAMKGLGTNEGVLIEIIGSRNNIELTNIKTAFHAMYGKPLEKWIKDETSGNFRKLLISLLQCQRSINPTPDMNQCQMDAQRLYQAGEGKWGTDESIFNQIFSSRSAAEIQCISQCYKNMRGKTLLKVIDTEFSGDIKNLLNTVVFSLIDLPGYYATRIRESLKGTGTNDSKLVRCIVSRAEIDMPAIKAAYLRLFNRDMLLDVRDDTSGDYKKILTHIIERAM